MCYNKFVKIITHIYQLQTAEQEDSTMTEFLNIALVAYTVLQAVMYIALAIRDDRENRTDGKQPEGAQC